MTDSGSFMDEHVAMQGENCAPDVYRDINSNPTMAELDAMRSIPAEELEALQHMGQNGRYATPVSAPHPQAPMTMMPDPGMRPAYTMPAAGLQRRRSIERHVPSRKYNMASDIFGTGMDRSWEANSAPPPNYQSQKMTNDNQQQQQSFKITEIHGIPKEASDSRSTDALDQFMNSNTRKTRESSGNPLTGQGYDSSTTKTAKRYFDGSNSNQKLW